MTAKPHFSGCWGSSVSALQYTVHKHEVFIGQFSSTSQLLLRYMMSCKARISVSKGKALQKTGGYIHCSSKSYFNWPSWAKSLRATSTSKDEIFDQDEQIFLRQMIRNDYLKANTKSRL